MFSMAKPVRGHNDLGTLLPVLAAIVVLALLGHFVADAANLWAGSNPPATSNTSSQHPGGGRQDAASALHTGFAVAIAAVTAMPAVLSLIRIWTYPQPQFRQYAPPFRPPKAH